MFTRRVHGAFQHGILRPPWGLEGPKNPQTGMLDYAHTGMPGRTNSVMYSAVRFHQRLTGKAGRAIVLRLLLTGLQSNDRSQSFLKMMTLLFERFDLFGESEDLVTDGYHRLFRLILAKASLVFTLWFLRCVWGTLSS